MVGTSMYVIVSSRGASRRRSRSERRTATASSPARSVAKSTPSRGCAAKSNRVTTPKFPPPPRRAQNRSMLRARCLDHLAVGGDDLRADQLIGGQTPRAHHPPDAAAQGESRSEEHT